MGRSCARICPSLVGKGLLRKKTSVAEPLAARIRDEIRSGALDPGAHLTAQGLADRFAVSRSPVGEALKLLAAQGAVTHAANKGYFVTTEPLARGEPRELPNSPVDLAYFALAEDRLQLKIPDVVSANFLRERYGLSSAEVQVLVTRIVKEGWLERRQGYGFQFTDMLNSADALAQTYRFRMALEPAALLEPGYQLDLIGAAQCRRVEDRILAGGVDSMGIEELYERGVQFHELIVSGSRNPFYLDALRRINSIRRLIAYRASSTRERYYGQAQEHMEILDLLIAGRNEEASWKLRLHLGHVIHNLAAIRTILELTAK